MRLWFASDWTSQPDGTGPGERQPALRSSALGPPLPPKAWWSLAVTPDGTLLGFLAQDANRQTTILQTPIRWHSGEWHQIALSWSAQETVLFVDGLRAATGPAVSLSPLTSFTGIRGFCIGSDVHGGQVADGQFEEVFTFDRACTDLEVAADYARTAPLAALGSITVEEQNGMVAASLLRTTSLLSEGTETAMSAAQNGCGLWLKIGRPLNDTIPLLLTNTRPSQVYEIRATNRLGPSSDWPVLATVTAHDTFLETTINVQGEPNLFVLAVEHGRVDAANFEGMAYDPHIEVQPPDPMGAAGNNYFVELVNGQVAVYDKSGLCRGQLDNKAFFHVDGDLPSATHLVDPRLVYDHHASRWVATAVDSSTYQGSGNVILAISRDCSPLPLPTPNDDGNWVKHVIYFQTAGSTDATDFDTLGVDDNGIYVTAIRYPSMDHKILAARTSELYAVQTSQYLEDSGGSWYKIWTQSDAAVGARTIQPVVNFDSVEADGYALFVAKGPPEHLPYKGGSIRYRRLKWPGASGNPDWADGDWESLPTPSTDYRDYFDLDEGTTKAPQVGGTSIVKLGAEGTGATVGSALAMAVIRGARLWTCHHVGLDGPDPHYNGGLVDRTRSSGFL